MVVDNGRGCADGEGAIFREQTIRILQEVESGSPVAKVARQYSVSEPTIFRWKRRYGELSESELKRLKALEEENGQLKKIVAQQVVKKP